MLASGNYIVPHLDYVAYIQKPPLLYWMCALSMRILGVNEFAARFVNALSALIGVAAVFYFTLRTFDRRRAFIAGVVLATTVLYGVMAQILTTDMLLTATITTALFAAYFHWRDGGYWRWLFYAAMGCGVLVKGPAGAVLPIVSLLLFAWWEGDLGSTIRRFQPISGLLPTLAIAAPWFIAISLREPGFFNYYFVGEHLRRFFDSRYSHNQPIYYYVPIVLGGLLPWTLTIPFLPWRRLAPNPARSFCLIAASTIFVIFSLSSAKLVPYILPAVPPIAVVLADGLAGVLELVDTRQQSERRMFLASLLLVVLGITLTLVAVVAPHLQSPNPMLVRPALYSGGAILIVSGIVSTVGFRRWQPLLGLSAYGFAAAALLIVISYGRSMAEPARSYASLARAIAQRAPDATLVCYPRYIQSLPFYSRRRVILVGPQTELGYGAAHAADASQYFFNGPKDLIKLWNRTPKIVLVVDRSSFPAIEPMLGPYEVVASDGKKLASCASGIPGRSRSSSLACYDDAWRRWLSRQRARLQPLRASPNGANLTGRLRCGRDWEQRRSAFCFGITIRGRLCTR